MFYTAEIFTSSGSRTSPPLVAESTLTPEPMLTKCLSLQEPQIFHPELSKGPGLGLLLPVADTQGLRACVTLVWQVDDKFAAALEVWRPGASGVLKLGDAYYGPQATPQVAFEQVSRQTSFSILEGLPGVTFDAREPVLFETLSHARGFVRSQAAAAAGLSIGLGIPVFKNQAASCAVLLLSSVSSPLARVFEIWKVGGRTLKRDSSLNLDAGETDEPDTDLAADTVKTGLPQLECHEANVRVALPVFRNKTVGSVVVLGG